MQPFVGKPLACRIPLVVCLKLARHWLTADPGPCKGPAPSLLRGRFGHSPRKRNGSGDCATPLPEIGESSASLGQRYYHISPRMPVGGIFGPLSGLKPAKIMATVRSSLRERV